MKKLYLLLAACIAVPVLAACSQPDEEEPAGLTDVTFMLDWVPNVNHTGIFVAQNMGYFEEAGLNVDIIQPGEVFAEQAVVSGAADYGVSFQEQLTLARADDVPLVSIAAVIQNNTSGFANVEGTGVESPADWEGLTYGSFGSPFEEPTLRALMECNGGDFSQLEMVDVGFSDPLALLDEGQIGLAWIFFGTQGTAAQQQGVDLHVEMMSDYFDCIPDYYTPLIIASEDTIASSPEVTTAFVGALSRGYTYAAENPAESADILLANAPESGEELLQASQEWLSPQYIADAAQWGIQELSVWENYTNWMAEQGLIEAPIDNEAAFTNEFLPE